MRAVGALVRFTFDHDPGDALEPGDVLRTDTGRMYRVHEVQLVARGDWAGVRSRVVAQVMPETQELEPGTRVWPMQWHERGHRQRG